MKQKITSLYYVLHSAIYAAVLTAKHSKGLSARQLMYNYLHEYRDNRQNDPLYKK